MIKLYVVCIEERHRDGTETFSKVVAGMPAALEYAARMCLGPDPNNVTVRVYELGAEVPIVRTERVEQVVSEARRTVFETA